METQGNMSDPLPPPLQTARWQGEQIFSFLLKKTLRLNSQLIIYPLSVCTAEKRLINSKPD